MHTCPRTIAMILGLSAALAAATASGAARDGTLSLQNRHLRADFRPVGGTWRLARLARPDGTDAMEVRSDEFEILLFDDSRFTADDYRAGPPHKSTRNGRQELLVQYRPADAASAKAPPSVRVTYSLAEAPVLHKHVVLEMGRGEKVDRLAVWRMSTDRKASRGGLGQPVFVGNWFLGADYPGFHSRHSDGFCEPNFRYRWFYDVDLAGRDKEFAPRKGLVSVFHFPGAARELSPGHWGVRGKRAVIGLSATRGEGAELALLDYIAATRRPPRSHLHVNNWYSPAAKNLSIESLLPNVVGPVQANLRTHGVALDAFVPDHGWENSKTFDRIFEPKLDDTHPPLPQLRKALQERAGTGLGIWIALDGTNQNIPRGLELGYRAAIPQGFKTTSTWIDGKAFFDMLDPKYLADLKRALQFLLADAGVSYIKHDFNHNFTARHPTQRHARERCLDVTLDLLAWERSLAPGVFQNYTNGTWFSPWWMQHADTFWMMSGDSGNSRRWPQLSMRDRSTSYRDEHFFDSFHNPARCPRPVMPISTFMTHGIIFTKKKPFTDGRDLPIDWSNHVVMHLARGTLVKELYLTPELLDDRHWEILGRALAWAVANQHRLVNTVYVGGNPGQGEVYGYVSWTGERAILAVRNPDRREQTLRVPFDRTVHYRGARGRAYRARAIYPYVEPVPWPLTSGEPLAFRVPGDSVALYELDPGTPLTDQQRRPAPLPPSRARVADGAMEIDLAVPDENLMRCDLVVQAWAEATVSLRINGRDVAPRQTARDARWTIAACDLRPWRGKEASIRATLLAPEAPRKSKPAIACEVWLVADRPVPPAALPEGAPLPFAIRQGHRRQTRQLIPRTPINVQPPRRGP